MNLEQFVEARLSDIVGQATSGVSELTGKTRREYYDEETGERGRIVGRFGGLNIKELQAAGVSPSQAARAIERGKGKVYSRIVREVEREGLREGFTPARRRSPGKPTIPPHEGRVYCSHCRTMHTKGQHRFHGSGSFHRTHLFSFKNPMTVTEASRVFANLMKEARSRVLSTTERAQLSRASQIIRYHKRKKYRANSSGEAESFIRFLRDRGFMVDSRTSKTVLAQLLKQHRKEFEQWKRGRSLFDAPGPLLKNRRKKLTRKKARLILHHGEVRGHELTAKQRVMFGARASGYPVRRPRRNGGDKTRMGKLVEIRYLRDHGRAPGYYKHEFKSQPTIYYTDAPVTVPAGAIVIFPRGK